VNLSLPEVELHYVERGRGPLALFIHGFGLDGTMWLDQLAALGHLRRCVALDLRGHGRSEIGTDPGHAIAYHTDDLLAAIARLGDPAVDLVGHSMGAHLARSLAARRPDAVRSLALFGVMDPVDYRLRGDRAPDALLGDRQSLARELAANMLDASASLFARARAVAMLESMHWATYYPQPIEGGWRSATLPRQPALFATGQSDAVTPPERVAAFAARHPDARFVAIPAAGHLAPVENPTAVSDALESFWRTLPRTAPAP